MWNTDSMRDRLNRGAELTEDPDINPNVKTYLFFILFNLYYLLVNWS